MSYRILPLAVLTLLISTTLLLPEKPADAAQSSHAASDGLWLMAKKGSDDRGGSRSGISYGHPEGREFEIDHRDRFDDHHRGRGRGEFEDDHHRSSGHHFEDDHRGRGRGEFEVERHRSDDHFGEREFHRHRGDDRDRTRIRVRDDGRIEIRHD